MLSSTLPAVRAALMPHPGAVLALCAPAASMQAVFNTGPARELLVFKARAWSRPKLTMDDLLLFQRVQQPGIRPHVIGRAMHSGVDGYIVENAKTQRLDRYLDETGLRSLHGWIPPKGGHGARRQPKGEKNYSQS